MAVRSRSGKRFCLSAVAEKLADIGTQTEFEQQSGKGVGIYTGGDDYLYCDALRIDDIREQVLALLLLLDKTSCNTSC